MISKTGERIAAVLSAAAAIYLAFVAWNFPAGGDRFPLFACASIVVIAIVMIARTFLAPGAFRLPFVLPSPVTALRPLLITAATVIYVLLFFQIGYYTMTLIYFVVMSWIIGVRRPLSIAVTALVMLPLMYAFFELFLNAQMPRGVLL